MSCRLVRLEQPLYFGGPARRGGVGRSPALPVKGIVGEDGLHLRLPQHATQRGALVIDAQAALSVEQAVSVGAGHGDGGNQRQQQDQVSHHNHSIAAR